jgi:hypothetical protein
LFTPGLSGECSLSRVARDDLPNPFEGATLVVVTGGQSRDRQGRRRGISFDAYCERLGNPDFISAEELADIIVFCWKEPQRICIRDIVVMPATSSFA